ncbi:hypothetical protein LSH36_313g00004 [Paralvinella palmiformis]|uniref:DUF659 domain-containing protein n=1 Tax=Paralvinella palmiformis TaxID=53620 RepID=A0AAD9JGY8_9ANNE|nr:hypothetical protein LSH36_313g00004 [Paralvinella palmiformis]
MTKVDTVAYHERKHPSVHNDTQTTKPATNQQQTMQSFVVQLTNYANHHPHQVQITDSLVMFIAGNLLQSSIAESPRFRDFCGMMDPHYQLASRKHLTGKPLINKTKSIQAYFKQQLKQTQSVCLITDLCQMKSFIGVTGHFIHDWSKHSITLASKRVKGCSTFENIHQQYEKIVTSFDITHKISHIITDNASNIIKAFNFYLPGFTGEYNKVSDANTDNGSDEDDALDSASIDRTVYEQILERDPCY